MADTNIKLEQARLLYGKCDRTGKGYLTREDMHRLKPSLPLTAEQLDAVFDSLDQDEDERLTFEEFFEGIGPYLGSVDIAGDSSARHARIERQTTSVDNDDSFQQSFQCISSSNTFQDLESIRAVWYKLRKENPGLLTEFEGVLTSISCELLRSKQEYEGLESALKKRIAAHEEVVHRLYEETEIQIKQERDRIISREKSRERELRNTLENELREKEKALQEIIKQHEDTQKRLKDLNAFYAETIQRREDLVREREDLECRLEAAEKALHECQDYISVLSKEARNERRLRACAAMELSEGIALERETLVRQLDDLREENRRLRDERDESLVKLTQFNQPLEGAGESLASLGLGQPSPGMGRRATYKAISAGQRALVQTAPTRRGSTMDIYFAPTVGYSPSLKSTTEVSEENYASNQTMITNDRDELPSPDGAVVQFEETDIAQARVFKIISIGNSGVGKTSIIQQYIKSSFDPTKSQTINVDVQTKTVVGADGVQIFLQIWDTAGQELYRSISKQYYRKADGVLLVYDVTDEKTYLDLRDWMNSIAEGVGTDVPVMILANKIDLPGPKMNPETARVFAKQYGALFYEVSAKSGVNVDDAFMEIIQ